jgi:pyridoxamine 5'-phosphate oxidase
VDIGDVDPDPIVQFRRWQADVLDAGLPEPTTMVLCTTPAGERSQPLARHVLLKGVDGDGFTWVSNQRSRKGRHLAANPHACLLFPWYPIGRQVIVTGTVTVASEHESDAYFATRPRESQISAWVSDQSQPVAERAMLQARWEELAERFGDGPIPRPPHWGMYRLAPDSIELWRQGLHRMHDRLLYERGADGSWRITRLWP